MPTAEPRELFEKYAAAVAYVCTKDRDGDEGMGTAFHVGDGVFLTARHVVENRQILELATTTQHYVPDEAGNTHIGSERFRTVGPGSGHVIKGPLFHPDSDVDVAALVVNGLEELPVIPLGSHLDDWINDDAFLLISADSNKRQACLVGVARRSKCGGR
jgi:S1-C subfamily serine protease